VATAIAAGFALACAAKKAGAPDAAAPADAAGAREAAEDIDALEAELQRYEAQLEIEGVMREKAALEGEDAGTPADASAGQGTPAGVPPDRCGRICELTESICELESRICSLAAAHDGETRYAAACERSGADCARGREACHACCG
jgi:hypothetical protein